MLAADQPETLTVRTTFGFLVSHDSGQNWDWICERAIGYSGVQDPAIGLMEGGTIVASLSEGIARSVDQGCSWSFAEADLKGAPVIDLTVQRAAPNHALALVWDAQLIGYSSRILASSDNGRSFLPYGSPIDPAVLVTTIDIAPSDAQRIYASGTRSVDGARSALLFRSDDAGQHWSEYPVPFDPKLEQGVYIAAVDPEDADTVYLRTNSATVSRLMISHDAGEQISAVYSGSLLSFALSPDGKRLYFGGEDGLYTGQASASEFEKRADFRVLCLAATTDTVYACSDEHSGFTVGASRDDGATFEPLLHLKTVRGPLACSATACESDWPLVRAQLGIPLPSGADAGAGGGAVGLGEAGSAGDAGGPAVPGPPAPTHSSCTTGPPKPSRAPAVGLLLAIFLTCLSRFRKSRARSRLPAK